MHSTPFSAISIEQLLAERVVNFAVQRSLGSDARLANLFSGQRPIELDAEWNGLPAGLAVRYVGGGC